MSKIILATNYDHNKILIDEDLLGIYVGVGYNKVLGSFEHMNWYWLTYQSTLYQEFEFNTCRCYGDNPGEAKLLYGLMFGYEINFVDIRIIN